MKLEIESGLDIITIVSICIVFLPIVYTIVYLYLMIKNLIFLSIENLLKNIKHIRICLNSFIFLNISISIIIIYYSFYESIVKSEILVADEVSNTNFTVTIFKLFIFCIAITIVCVLLFYLLLKLIYGRFLKKLHANYRQLKEMV